MVSGLGGTKSTSMWNKPHPADVCPVVHEKHYWNPLKNTKQKKHTSVYGLDVGDTMEVESNKKILLLPISTYYLS